MTVQLTTRVDKATKLQFDKVCERIGVSSSNALNIFVKGVINHNGIPFKIVASPETSPPPKPFAYGEVSIKPPIAAEDSDVFARARKEGRKLTREEAFGCMRGKFNIPDDFNEPLEDFKEYME